MKRRTLGITSLVVAATVAWACSDSGPAPTEVDTTANAYLYRADAPGGGGGKAKSGSLPTGCAAGQVAIKNKSLDPNNEEWICADDRDNLGELNYMCADGQVPKWDDSAGPTGDWVCGDDNVGGGSGGTTVLWGRHTCAGTLCNQASSPGLTMTVLPDERMVLEYTSPLQDCVVSGSVNETGTAPPAEYYLTSGIETSGSYPGAVYVRLVSPTGGPTILEQDIAFGVSLVCPF